MSALSLSTFFGAGLASFGFFLIDLDAVDFGAFSFFGVYLVGFFTFASLFDASSFAYFKVGAFFYGISREPL